MSCPCGSDLGVFGSFLCKSSRSSYCTIYCVNLDFPTPKMIKSTLYIYIFSYLGLSLYFNLARHAFGDVQKILFPKYFSLNSLLSAITLIQFGKMHVAAKAWDVHTYLQVCTQGLYLYLRVHIVKNYYLFSRSRCVTRIPPPQSPTRSVTEDKRPADVPSPSYNTLLEFLHCI